MSETEVKWFHSGLNNDDLGGSPSRFEIADSPVNNLFSNVSPEDATAGLTDYRCFYIVNKYQDTTYDITLDTTAAVCATVNTGSVVQNDVQKIIFHGHLPSDNGYFIIQLDWGPELTIYWSGSYANMAADMQAKIRLVQFHDSVTVIATDVLLDGTGATFEVTFAGQVQNRRMGLIQLVQNNLVQSVVREYRVDNKGAALNSWNFQGCTAVQVHNNILPDTPDNGMIHIPYPYNDTFTPIPDSWTYMHLSYTSFNTNIFNLLTPIPTIPVPPPDTASQLPEPPPPCLNENDEVWVDIPNLQPVNIINISRIREGSPINQTAQVLEFSTDTPIQWSDQGGSFHVGMVKPLEGFFIWIKRTVTAGAVGCADSFSITLNGISI